MGLLESIPSAALIAREDAEDADGNGISGRAHRLPDGRIGRFGWKAAQGTVREQTAAAFNEDLGITSPPRSETSCTPLQTVCRGRPHGNDPKAAWKYRSRYSAAWCISSPTSRRRTPAS